MDEKAKENGRSDVEELLLPDDRWRSGAKTTVDTEVEETLSLKALMKTPAAITIMIVLGLVLIGILIIVSNPSLNEQFQYIMRGELGKYKSEMARLEEEKIRDIENLTGNKYGSVTLFYSPQDAKVDIKQMKYAKDCSKFAGVEDDVLACLKKEFDYNLPPTVTPIDNKSLHLNRDQKEIVESLPFTDMPIQESNDERNIVWAYEVQIEITREGYEPRKFHFTGDKARIGALGEGWESKFWDMKGPGLFMVDFQGADLAPLPETAKNNYIAAVKEFECIKREVVAKRESGKSISEDQVSSVFSEILSKNGIKTRDDFYKIESFLRQTELQWFEGFLKELEKLPCPGK